MSENKKGLGQRARDFIKYHLVDSTAVATVATPMFAVVETVPWAVYEKTGLLSERIADTVSLPHDISFKAKLLGAAAIYGGIGWLVKETRKVSRDFFNITQKSNEKIQRWHDRLHLATFNLCVSPVIYYASGSRSLQELAFPMTLAVGIGLVSGGLNGFAIDSYEDLFGLEECERERYPAVVKRQRPIVKKGLAALVTASVIGVSSLFYQFLPDKADYNRQENPISYSQSFDS